jgi:hypothetical protein
MSISELIKEMTNQQLLTLHTCLICIVLDVYEDGTAKIHPLTVMQTASGETVQHQALDHVPMTEQVKNDVSTGSICVAIFAERDISGALNGEYYLPSVGRHHSLSDGIIIGTLGKSEG